MVSTLGHMVEARLRIARTVYWGQQTLTTILQRLVRRALLGSSLVRLPLSVPRVQQAWPTWTETRLRPVTLARVVASRHKDQLHAIPARVEQQILTPRPPLNVRHAGAAPTPRWRRCPAIPVMLARQMLIPILLHRAYSVR